MGDAERADLLEGLCRRVVEARETERFLRRLGFAVFGVGVACLVAVFVSTVVGWTDVEQAVVLVVGSLLATVVSGTTPYAAGVNMGLAAGRLELAISGAG